MTSTKYHQLNNTSMKPHQLNNTQKILFNPKLPNKVYSKFKTPINKEMALKVKALLRYFGAKKKLNPAPGFDLTLLTKEDHKIIMRAIKDQCKILENQQKLQAEEEIKKKIEIQRRQLQIIRQEIYEERRRKYRVEKEIRARMVQNKKRFEATWEYDKPKTMLLLNDVLAKLSKKKKPILNTKFNPFQQGKKNKNKQPYTTKFKPYINLQNTNFRPNNKYNNNKVKFNNKFQNNNIKPYNKFQYTHNRSYNNYNKKNFKPYNKYPNKQINNQSIKANLKKKRQKRKKKYIPNYLLLKKQYLYAKKETISELQSTLILRYQFNKKKEIRLLRINKKKDLSNWLKLKNIPLTIKGTSVIKKKKQLHKKVQVNKLYKSSVNNLKVKKKKKKTITLTKKVKKKKKLKKKKLIHKFSKYLKKNQIKKKHKPLIKQVKTKKRKVFPKKLTKKPLQLLKRIPKLYYLRPYFKISKTKVIKNTRIPLDVFMM